jgi:ribonuclease D
MHSKNLKNVFDTQVAVIFRAWFTGQLSKCPETNVDIDIDKDQTRSDWLARPLT